MQNAVIVSAVRTPIGLFDGALAALSAPELGAIVIRHALLRARVLGGEVDELVMGQVLLAGAGQAPARQAARRAGVPASVPCTTVNKVCGSGLKAVMMIDQAVRAGDVAVAVAGGMESMSGAPHLVPGARRGFRMGDRRLLDAMVHDGLWDPFEDVHMGAFGDAFARANDVSREAQDAYAHESYTRARAAAAGGAFDDEIVPVEVGGVTVRADEEPARYAPGKMESLPPAFTAGGTVTAANASKVNDGAAALVLMSQARATRGDAHVLATIRASATFAGEAREFPAAPARAIERAAAIAGIDPRAIDLFEISEAFAVVPLVAMRALGVPRDRLNVRGGAISLGHPLGCSGARLLVTLLSAMKAGGARTGCVSLCLGGGEAVALIVER